MIGNQRAPGLPNYNGRIVVRLITRTEYLFLGYYRFATFNIFPCFYFSTGGNAVEVTKSVHR
jgi:hypothetical protein